MAHQRGRFLHRTRDASVVARGRSSRLDDERGEKRRIEERKDATSPVAGVNVLFGTIFLQYAATGFHSTRCSLSLPFRNTRFSDSRANQIPSYTSNSRRRVLESRIVPVSPVAPVATLPPLPLGVASKRDVTGIVGELGIPVHAVDIDALIAVDRAAADELVLLLL